MAYWELLAEFINHEPIEERDRFYMATLVPLGFEKGKPFKPSARQKKILEENREEILAKRRIYERNRYKKNKLLEAEQTTIRIRI